jgi:hypothetical protein
MSGRDPSSPSSFVRIVGDITILTLYRYQTYKWRVVYSNTGIYGFAVARTTRALTKRVCIHKRTHDTVGW